MTFDVYAELFDSDLAVSAPAFSAVRDRDCVAVGHIWDVGGQRSACPTVWCQSARQRFPPGVQHDHRPGDGHLIGGPACTTPATRPDRCARARTIMAGRRGLAAHDHKGDGSVASPATLAAPVAEK